MGANAKALAEKLWEWRARAARVVAMERVPELGRVANLSWYGFDEGKELIEHCGQLGRSPDRVIQRWDDPGVLAERLEEVLATADLGDCVFLLQDYPDAGPARGSVRDVVGIAVSALDSMINGVALTRPADDSIVSIDVEERHGKRWIETTLIGEGFPIIRDALRLGPEPLVIVNN